uniref:DUF834 domain-containing protein n=1 Tax=Oryza meridionalis TaxID=40149 RepID=A0A0E0CSQ1_9ORYZ
MPGLPLLFLSFSPSLGTRAVGRGRRERGERDLDGGSADGEARLGDAQRNGEAGGAAAADDEVDGPRACRRGVAGEVQGEQAQRNGETAGPASATPDPPRQRSR